MANVERAAPATGRVALVNVPYGGGGQSMRPIGIAFIVAYLRQHGYAPTAYDLSDSPRPASTLVETLGLDRFDVVGLSFYNVNATLAYELAREIKQRNPACLVVAGGAHPSAADLGMLERQPAIDVVVRNEGELTFLELLERHLNGQTLAGLPGISHRIGGRLVRESDRERVSDLDALAAPVVRFTTDSAGVEEKPMFFIESNGGRAFRRRKALAMVTSRSCPYNCSFCAIILIGRKWRAASPRKVGEDFLALDRDGGGDHDHVYFLDANFFVDVKRAVAIGEELQRVKPGTTFSFSTRVNQIIRAEDSIGRLTELGLRSIEIGIESASAAALERYAKDVTPEQNDQALLILKKNNLQLGLDFIMFDAEATLTDLEHNLTFLARHQLDEYAPWDHIFNALTPYLGTPIRKHYERLKLRRFDDDVLPDPKSLFVRRDVRRVFEEIDRLKDSIPTISAAIQGAQVALETNEWGPEIARHLLNGITLRRYFYSTLRRLVKAAVRGETPALEQAVPPLWTQDHRPATLDDLVQHELS